MATEVLDRTVAATDPPGGSGFAFGRDLAPVGRVFRLVFVLIAIASLGSRIAHQLHGAQYLAMALYAILIFAFYTGFVWLANRYLTGRLSPWTAAAILQAPMLLYPMQVGPATFHNALAVFTTISALLCPLIGYGGLEVAAFPALVLGTRPVLYSPFNTVDVIERAYRSRASGRGVLWWAAIALSVVCVVDFWYAPLLLTVPVVDRNVSHGILFPQFVALLLVLPTAYLAVLARRARGDRSAVVPPGGWAHRPARLLALAAGCTALLMLVFLGKQVPDHTLWGLILLVGIIVGVVRLFRRPARQPEPVTG